ncbi:PTS sugar transporter subunit IIB [Vibrio sp. TH_r3]|uniref:PTS sugar transporter subunit IIB n=1 Tax=Vibrio sp. TH_r3 TaxID=3082084 RepID=UPI002952FDFC|nr:PTS sugar transporter subunit IIB [Vibrio sp. TH_r3]MDV7105091.1 PTS sugar transporter subunit IIB [Vibrio sp. TH_r3]
MTTKIFLICSAGMSTSMVVNKMRDAAVSKGVDVEIKAYSLSEFNDVVDKYDVCLVAPQVSYQFESFNKVCEEKGLGCGKIEMMDYGMQRGDVILDQALALVK